MTLQDGKIGSIYLIKDIEIKSKLAARLQALGLNYNTKVEIINKKKSGAMIIRVRGTRLAIGKPISVSITVEEKTKKATYKTTGGVIHA